jgi:methionine-rich copper-binding protein CopC
MRKGILIAALLFRPGGCWAHVFPVRSEPRVGTTVTTVPTQITILFDGEMEPVFSTIEVKDGNKVQVDKKDSHIDAKDPDKLAVSLLPTLAAGEYHVEWRAVARDGHLTMGHFSFWIKGGKP